MSEEIYNDNMKNPDVVAIMKFFEREHLNSAELREVSYNCHLTARFMAANIPASGELVAGLRKLLEAKDCFVRAAL